MSRVSTLLLVLTSWLVSIPSAAVAAIPTPSDDISAVDEPNVPSSQFVRRAILTTAIDAREPVDNYNAKEIPSDTKKLYFFTEMVNKADEYVTHRWFLNGKLVAEIVLDIGSDRWRTYSSKNLMPSLRGTWEVEVVDQQNRLLATTSFTY